MTGSARVLGPGCGPLDAPIFFIGEAPGRLGADGSHLPFHGDKAGHNFESLIEQVGISRYKVFVTNAVLCNPKDTAGNNSTPTRTEIANCAPFLKEQIDIVQPDVVVSLGSTALNACNLVAPHTLTLKMSVRTKNKWYERVLVPVYHPGQRAMMHRSFANQLADYQFVVELARRRGRPKKGVRAPKESPGSINKKLSGVAKRILEKKPDGISYFALHKLYFMAEVVHMDETGERLTNTYVIRQKDGPYCVDLHLSKLAELVPGIIISRDPAGSRIRITPQLSFEESNDAIELSPAEILSIDRAVQRYGDLSDAELKKVAYLSRPMRALLRKEKALHMNLFNAAVLPYQEKSTSR